MNLEPEGRRSKDFEFWPNAMLPAWFVTDRELVIRKTNKLAEVLIKTFGIEDCSNRRFLSLDTGGSTSGEPESLLYCILDPNYQNNLNYLRATREILQEHLAILREFNDSGTPCRPEPLIDKLCAVPEREGVKPYVYSLSPDDSELRIGIKVAPPQGLRLIGAAEVENAKVEFIDVVMAYRVIATWTQEPPGLLKGACFIGAQPAIHDATERHRMWEKSKVEEEAKITQFLSHALNTPLANTQSILNAIKRPGLDHAVREEKILELESIVTDLSDLVRLLLFINTSADDITAPIKLVTADDGSPWECFSLVDVESAVAIALQSVHNRRTRNQTDVEKIEALFRAEGLSVPSRDVDGEGIRAYERLARDISSTEGFAAGQVFAIRPFTVSGRIEHTKVSETAKTVLLKLLLVELIVNAVKNADESAPVVTVNLRLHERGDKLEIRVFNNGAELNPDIVQAGESIKSHGEKRKTLGWLLNQKAAKLFKWDLTVQPPPTKGTLFVIGIPINLEAQGNGSSSEASSC
jgi:signal transduction histidine kinase